MKSSKRGMLILLFTVFLSSFASAEILFSQPKTLYNLNDRFEIKINLVTQTEVSDFLVAKLVCAEQEIEVYRSPITIIPPENQEARISVRLGQFLIGTINGNCYIKATFGGEESISQSFEITPEIDLEVNVEGAVFSPNDKVKIVGTAIKKNGEKFKGFLEINVPQLNLKLSNSVDNGTFVYEFIVPPQTAAGTYDIEILAYEKDTNNAVTNQGTAQEAFSVRQVIKKVSIALDSSSTLPDKELTYSVYVTDQSDSEVNSDIAVTISKADKATFDKKIVKSGQPNKIVLSSDAQPGAWMVEAKVSDLVDSQEFLVEEYKKLSFEFDSTNKTLLVKNVGNVQYTGPVEISIGDVREIKDIALNLGESKAYRLRAPNGQYSISASDGSDVSEFGMTTLTGRAISVSDANSLDSNLWTLLLLVLILVLAVAAVFIYKKLSKRNPLKGTEQQNIKFNTPKGFAPGSDKKATPFETNSIDKGNREEATIISLFLRNQNLTQNNPVMQVVDSALWKAKEAGAKVYSDENFRIIILSESLTKQKDNSIKAVKLAQDMGRVLTEHNKHSPNKIDFGIGVHEGSLIIENSNNNFKFVSLDSSMVNTKKLSQHSNSELLISERVHRKTLGKVKTMKVSDKNFWKVERIVDREEHRDYIRRSLKKE